MNTDQQARLEIMRALEKDFPDRLLEDLVHVARYVEQGGTEPETPEQTETPSGQGERRMWTTLADIPDSVLAVTDPDGDVIRRIALGNRLVWKFEATRYDGIAINDTLAPFTEVLS